MADIVSREKRSEMMSGIRGADTSPELQMRRGLHGRGFRYRLHDKGILGKPDLVFPKYRAVMFINGCFWHGHNCHLFKWPKSRKAFWREKIGRNRERDTRNIAALLDDSWRVATVWECALKGRRKKSFDLVLDQCTIWLKGYDKKLVIRGHE